MWISSYCLKNPPTTVNTCYKMSQITKEKPANDIGIDSHESVCSGEVQETCKPSDSVTQEIAEWTPEEEKRLVKK